MSAIASATSLGDPLITLPSNPSINDAGKGAEASPESASVRLSSVGTSPGFLDRLFSLFHFIFPQSCSPLDVAALLVKNCAHHRITKQYYSLDNKHRFRIFRLVNSQGFRKTSIVCALILAFLPTIEVPVAVAAPCWLSFAMELCCYTVISLRICFERMCFESSLSKNPWFSLLNASVALCWVDAVITMALVSSSGGDWTSFNNCGMPEPGRELRSASWVYIIGRFSRCLPPPASLRFITAFQHLIRVPGTYDPLFSWSGTSGRATCFAA
jgi:hypothetical protein